MRFRTNVSAVAVIAVLTATTFQFAAPLSADARGGGVVTQGGHHIQTPPPVQPVPVDNVRNFGAVGDGVTDDTNAIQNATNDATSRHIGVFFPPGTYLHANSITFNGVSVTGSGTASQLVSNNPTNCSVILTGVGPSIQNIVISTQSLTGPPSPAQPTTLTIQNATSFTVSNNTIVQGSNITGIFVQTSSVGSINSNVCDGTGNPGNVGILIEEGANITVDNNLLQNEATGIEVRSSLYIAIESNTVGNVAFPTQVFGIFTNTVVVLDISQNTVQMANSNPGLPFDNTAIFPELCDQFAISGNSTWGGFNGIFIGQTGPTGSRVTQNVIHNCGGSGITVDNGGASAIQVTGNAFGECGLFSALPVIAVGPSGADASGATTFIQNNSYQGHLNNLTFYVQCLFTSPNIPAANVTGNTQTQTTLQNSI
jgi:parallel beta-helix repeat protein